MTTKHIQKKLTPYIVFCSCLEQLQMNRRHSMFFAQVNLNEMVMCLEDLINYFAQPEDDIGKLVIFVDVFNFCISRTRRETEQIKSLA